MISLQLIASVFTGMVDVGLYAGDRGVIVHRDSICGCQLLYQADLL